MYVDVMSAEMFALILKDYGMPGGDDFSFDARTTTGIMQHMQSSAH